MERHETPGDNSIEPPPFLRKWGRVYTAVLGFLAALIVLFLLFQREFTP